MCPQLFIGCSGWNYSDTSEKGGWLHIFYPDNKTRKLNYYSQFFDTVEMDATFYKRFYQHMTKGLFIGLVESNSLIISKSQSKFQKQLLMRKDWMLVEGVMSRPERFSLTKFLHLQIAPINWVLLLSSCLQVLLLTEFKRLEIFLRCIKWWIRYW